MVVTACKADRDTAAGVSTVGVNALEAIEDEVVFVRPKIPPVAPVAVIAETALCSLVQERI